MVIDTFVARCGCRVSRPVNSNCRLRMRVALGLFLFLLNVPKILGQKEEIHYYDDPDDENEEMKQRGLIRNIFLSLKFVLVSSSGVGLVEARVSLFFSLALCIEGAHISRLTVQSTMQWCVCTY